MNASPATTRPLSLSAGGSATRTSPRAAGPPAELTAIHGNIDQHGNIVDELVRRIPARRVHDEARLARLRCAIGVLARNVNPDAQLRLVLRLLEGRL